MNDAIGRVAAKGGSGVGRSPLSDIAHAILRLECLLVCAFSSAFLGVSLPGELAEWLMAPVLKTGIP